MIEIVVLSIIQGVTEFLPISSSAHLIITAKYFNFNNQNLTLDMSLHLGSLLAIIFYFKKDLSNLINNNNKLFLKITLSSVPVIIFGFFLVQLNLIDYLRGYKIIGWSTVFFAVLLYFSDLVKVKKKFKRDFKYSSALYIGFFQVISLVPGVSRSGIAITAARLLNFGRIDAAQISFLISIPILSVVSLYNLQSLLINKNFYLSLLNFLGIFLSFIFSYATIKYFLKFLKRFSLLTFVVYRLILGSFILIYAY